MWIRQADFCCDLGRIVDIYDGDPSTGPVVYHGKTLTSKISLRSACLAISKYAFDVSPYPIIISAEVHCGIPQQEMMVDIMVEVFGESLVREPVEGRRKIEVLPCPEELRGKVLFKAKNAYVTAQNPGGAIGMGVDGVGVGGRGQGVRDEMAVEAEEEWEASTSTNGEFVPGAFCFASVRFPRRYWADGEFDWYRFETTVQ